LIFIEAALAIIIVISVVFFLLGLVSQKGKAPGLENGRLKDVDSKPNVASSEDGTQPERHVEPLAATLKQAKAAVIAQGGTITSESDDYISATFMSRIFKFVDDVELRRDGDKTHIRSASRVGYSDNGVNAKRVEAIRVTLNP